MRRRIACMLTQEQLAKVAGVSERTVRRAELGEPIDLASLRDIVGALNRYAPELAIEPLDPAKMIMQSISRQALVRLRKEAAHDWKQATRLQSFERALLTGRFWENEDGDYEAASPMAPRSEALRRFPRGGCS